MSRQSTEASVRGISKKEGDRIAAMVLRVVRSIVDPELEPTGCGHLSKQDRHVVFNRSR